jgi:outer membrane receptor for ferrienterochelin and colicins
MLFAQVGLSQTDAKDSINRKELTEVTVTGQHKPQSVRNSVYQVRIISKERIQRQSATKLQDVLNNELNIRFSQDLATGGSDMSMLGLSGQNVKILIDGVPMIGRQGTSNEININQIDVNSIERIEIIEGPLSVVYGADALAGVINIITKKPGGKKLSLNARVHEETIGKEYGLQQGIHNQYIGANWNYRNWQFAGNFGRNLFNGWRGDTTGRELTWHKKDQLIANALIGYRNSRFGIYYRLDGLDEIITNPANNINNQPAVDQDYLTKRVMQQIQSSYTFNGKWSANVLASHTWFERQLYSTLFYPNGDVRVSTAPGAHSSNQFNGLTLRGTAVYKPYEMLSFQSGFDINSEKGSGERIKAGANEMTDYAFFITSEITPVKRINIRPGIRFIKNSVYDAPPVIYSLNTKFLLAKDLDLRLAYARGFRAPSIRELYFDFRDASHDILGNENLEAEQSNSFTGSLSWKAYQRNSLLITAQLTGFANDVDNMITYIQSPNDPRVTTYGNVDKYKTRGGTIGTTVAYKQFTGNAGFSYTGYYNQFYNQDKSLPSYTKSAELNSNLSYRFVKAGLDINFFYKYTGKRPFYQLGVVNGTEQTILTETDPYNWADLTVNKKLHRFFTLNAGIRNLFDVTTVNNNAVGSAHSNGGARPVGYGRSYFAGLTFNFEK